MERQIHQDWSWLENITGRGGYDATVSSVMVVHTSIGPYYAPYSVLYTLYSYTILLHI